MLDDLAEGELLGVETERGARVCLVNHDGAIHAIANNCTHQDFAMSDGCLVPKRGRCIVECSWHGAQFDCITGEVLKPPASEPLPVYRVMVDDGRIFIGGVA
jgi:3-phenylpropionate/trans-cinnamate dioxygenase ferredoxin subunit